MTTTTATSNTTMKALEFVTSTGEILEVEIPKPTLPSSSNSKSNSSSQQPNLLLVKVVASVIDAGLAKNFPGKFPDGLFIHSSARPMYLGWHFSGIVEEIAANSSDTTAVDGITVGTAVFGFLEYAPTQKQGSFAEYIVVNSQQCAIKPDGVSFELAAASATEAATALQALRDCGRIASGQKVLICGASGGVGSVAIGIAKNVFGAHVTAMCSERDVQHLQKVFQPDAILNRSQYATDQDPIQAHGQAFDIIFDCPSAFASYKYFNCLKPKGTFVVTTPSLGLLLGFWYSLFTWWTTSKRVRMVMAMPTRSDFTMIGEWLAQGKIQVPIDQVFDVSDMAAAIAKHNGKSGKGRIVIKVQDGWNNTIATASTTTTVMADELKKEK